MAREIKFRVWDAQNKMFHNDEEGYIADSEWIGINELIKFVQPNFILMQYTGLKDKNGKEIYEGDLLKYVFDWETYIPDSEETIDNSVTHIREVVFEGGAFRMKNEVGILAEARNNNIEIIGNIYEHPELIK